MIPKVAVIMSVYINDDPSFLSYAIDSILKQSYQSFDLFIYVDGHIGNDLIKEIERHSDNQTVNVYFGKENKGLAFALNFLIKKVRLASRYDYVARMDSDDISLLNRLELQVSFMERNRDVGVSGAYCQEFGSKFAKTLKKVPLDNESLYDFAIIRCPFIHPTVIFRTSVLHDDINYPQDTKLTEDMALWFKLMSQNVVFANIPHVVLKYRMLENTVERRLGFGKAVSEFSLRYKNMRTLKKFSFKNIFSISFRLVFHMLPTKVATYLYVLVR